MDLIIADFVTPVKTDSNYSISFSVSKMALSLRVLQHEQEGDSSRSRELTEDEKLRIPLISQLITACKSHASFEGSYSSDLRVWERFRTTITLGSKNLFQIIQTNPEVKATVSLAYERWKGAGFRDLATKTVANKLTSAYNYVPISHQFQFDPAPNIHVRILVHFPKSMMLSSLSTEGHPPVRRILEEGTFSDVTIVAANGVEIKGHKSFLGVQSPVLTAMFLTDMQESKSGRVDMSDISEPGIWAFLRYLYYGDLTGPKEDPEIAFQVLYASHKYQVGVLEAEVMQCLMERKNEDFNVEVAFKIYMFLRNLETESAVQLKTKTIQILIGKMAELRKLQKYRDLFEDSSNSEIAMQVVEDFAKTQPLPVT